MTSKDLNGSLMIYSNAPTAPTGYGRQVHQLLEKMNNAGLRTAVACNYGQQGSIGNYKTKVGKTKLYPMSLQGYSVDTLNYNFEHFKRNQSNAMLMTLYDTWVLHENKKLDNYEIHSWTPVDHTTIPSAVAQWVMKDNVHPIAMAPDGQRQMKAIGIESDYIPHMVDMKTFKPGQKVDGLSGKKFLRSKDGDFIFGMVAANKANSGMVHRKALAENILAFGYHIKKHPNSYLYLHMEATRSMQGFDVTRLLKVNNIPPERVIFPDPMRLRYGFTDTEMAAIYDGIDCLLAPSYGEGFQVPLIEHQAVGGVQIASKYTAPQDLVGQDSYLVDGQVFWDEKQGAYYQIPFIAQIVEAMEHAVDRQGRSDANLEFAQQFDTDRVWQQMWMPYLSKHMN